MCSEILRLILCSDELIEPHTFRVLHGAIISGTAADAVIYIKPLQLFTYFAPTFGIGRKFIVEHRRVKNNRGKRNRGANAVFRQNCDALW